MVICNAFTATQRIFVLVTITFICYYNSLGNELVHDDIKAIVKNPDVQSNSSLSKIFFNDFWGREILSNKSHKSYRPLCILSFRLNYIIHGLSPFGYHFANSILHLLVVLLFYNTLQAMVFHNGFVSFVTAALFTAHPVHVEAVTGVVGRAEVMSCLVFLIAFQVYGKYLDKVLADENGAIMKYELPLCLILGLVCLLIKENSFSIFGVFILIDIAINFDAILPFIMLHIGEYQKRWKLLKLYSLMKRITAIMITATVILYFRLRMNGMREPIFLYEDNPASFSNSFSTRVMTYSYLAVFNVKLLLAPALLSYDWQGATIPLVEKFTDIRNFETLCAFILLVAFAVFILKELFQGRYEENKPLIIGMILMILPFIPASNIFLTVGFVAAERVLYIPSLGFCIIVSYGLKKVHDYTEKKNFVLFLFLFFMSLFCVKTICYNQVWKSRATLFKYGVEMIPNNAKIHYNYANYLSDSNQTNEAIFHYKTALKIDPKHSSSHNNVGLLLSNLTERKHHFLEAIKYTPGHFRAMLNVANVFRKEERFHDAEEYLRRCLRLSPSYYDAKLLFADTLHKIEKDSEARAVYKDLVASHPQDNNLQLSYGQFLIDIGYLYDAMNVYKRLLSVYPFDSLVLLNVAKIYKRTKQYSQAILYFEKAISVNPNEATAYQSLMSFHYDLHEYEKAKYVSERLMKYSPQTVENVKNHGVILYRCGENEKAVTFIQENMKFYENASVDLHHVFISILTDLKISDKRAVAIRRAAMLFPNDTKVLLHLGDLERELKRYEESLKIFSRVLEGENEHRFNALHAIANIHHILRNIEEARKYYELALELNPSDGTLLRNFQKFKRIAKSQNVNSNN